MQDNILSQHLQDSFVFLATTDDKFISLVRAQVQPSYFSSQVTEDMVLTCYAYYDQFKRAPRNHLFDELSRRIKDRPKEDKDSYLEYMEKIANMHPPDIDYVIKRMSDFVKAREFEATAIGVAELVEKGGFDEARQLMQKALKIGIAKEEVGLFYFDHDVPTYYDYGSDDGVLLPTGISHLDSYIEGFRRGQFVCILGGYKGKKSWFQVHLGKMALLRGLNVLYLSHEMKSEEVEMRFDMALGGLVSTKAEQVIEVPIVDGAGSEKSIERIHFGTVYNPRNVKRTRHRVRRFGGKLLIKKYPMGLCTIEEMDRVLDYLEMYEGFVPDVLINDYIDIMSMPTAREHRDRINQAYIEHKRIADERNILVITVSQAIRAALSRRKLTQKDFAEDIRKIANVDIAIATSQDETLLGNKVMRIWVIGNRSGRQDCGCYIKQNIDAGQYCTDSWPIRDDDEQA